MDLLVSSGYFLTSGLKCLSVDALLKKLAPKLQGCIRRNIFKQLISQEVPLILENIDYVETGVGLNIPVVLGLQALFNCDLAPEYNKVVLKCRLAQLLAPHYLENGLELVAKLHTLHKGT